MKFVEYLITTCHSLRKIDIGYSEIEEFSAKTLSEALRKVHGHSWPAAPYDPRILYIRARGNGMKKHIRDPEIGQWVRFVDDMPGKNLVLERIQLDGLTEKPTR